MTWEDIRIHAVSAGVPVATAAAEVLHVVILDALFGASDAGDLAFQGGTCLHLVHGGYRFSEDLDLIGAALDAPAATRLLSRARADIDRLAVAVLGPGTAIWKTAKPRGRIQTWWLHFTPASERAPVRVKIELAQYPAYAPTPLPVRSELDLLARRPLVNALSPGELLAEKVTAVLGRPYVKGRDLFDLWYLDTVLDAPLDPELLRRKLADYNVDATRARISERLGALAAADIAAEMERFLPDRHRRLLGATDYAVVKRAAVARLRTATAHLRPRGER